HGLFTLAAMSKRFITLSFAVGLATACAVTAQSPTPGESPAGAHQTAKHRAHKKPQTTASPGETTASASPAAAPATSPAARRGRKKASTGAAATPAPSASPAASPAAAAKTSTRKKAATAASPSPSPGKFSLS